MAKKLKAAVKEAVAINFLDTVRDSFYGAIRRPNMSGGGSGLKSPSRERIKRAYVHSYESEQHRMQRELNDSENPYSKYFGGLDPRRRQEMADGGMIREDGFEMANLPRRAIHCEYPRQGFYSSPYIDDAAPEDII